MRAILFQNPSMAYFFAGLPLLAFLYILLTSYRRRIVDDSFSSSLLMQFSSLRSPYLFWIKTAALIFAWGFIVFSLMEPTRGRREPAYDSGMQYVYFALDASDSMLVDDETYGTDRFSVAKRVIDALLVKLNTQMVALYTWTTQAEEIVPLTPDMFFVQLVLSNLGTTPFGRDGTSLQSLKEIPVQDSASNTLIILTDAEATKGESSPSSSFGDAQVLVVGLGSDQGGIVPFIQSNGQQVISQRNIRALHQLGGQLFLSSERPPEKIADELYKQILLRQDKEGFADKQKVQAEPAGVFFLIGASLLLILVLCLPDTTILAAMIFLLLPAIGFANFLDLADAGNFQLAKEQIKARISSVTTLYEESVLYYDLAVAALMQEDYEQAITYLEAISLKEDPQPILAWYLYHNLAFAYAKNVEILMQRAWTYEDKEIALFEIQRGRAAIRQARKNACRYRRVYRLDCNETHDLDQLESYLKDFKTQAIAEKAHPNPPKDTESLAQEKLQEMVISARRLLEKMRGIDDVNTLRHLQMQQLQDVQAFYEIAEAEQKRSFQNSIACQYSPWSYVIPAVVKGKEAIESGRPTLQNAQKTALTEWQKALDSFSLERLPCLDEDAFLPAEESARILQRMEQFDQSASTGRKELKKRDRLW